MQCRLDVYTPQWGVPMSGFQRVWPQPVPVHLQGHEGEAEALRQALDDRIGQGFDADAVPGAG